MVSVLQKHQFFYYRRAWVGVQLVPIYLRFQKNRKYFDFVKKVRQAGINIPIIPGIKPFRKQSQLTIIPKTFKVDIPQELALEALKCKTEEDTEKLGVEWCIHQCKELIEHGVPSIHFYSVGAVDSIKEVAKMIY